MQVNRYLKDQAMDRIDHALGRPLDPIGETYRNCYATGGALADELAKSPLWHEGTPGRAMRYFYVSDAGRQELARHLRAINDPHRAFTFTFDGHTRTVIAASRSKARYSYYLDLCEVLPDLTFADYCRRCAKAA